MIKKFLEYIQAVRVEMLKVTWPSKDELLNSTTVVIVVSLAFAIFIFSADRVLGKALGAILKM